MPSQDDLPLNPDYRDMLSALSAEGAESLVVGAFAVAAHGLPRATKDIDIWVRPEPDNLRRVWRAMATFGAPMDQHSFEDLLQRDTIHQIGVAPNRIDIFKSVLGVNFDEAWPERLTLSIDGVEIHFPSRRHLIQSKIAAGRGQDLIDVQRLLRQQENLENL